MPPLSPVDPVFVSSRREALLAFGIWGGALIWTVGYCARFGYGREPETIRFYWGVPDWVAFGVVLPWSVCFVLSYCFSMWWMRDEDLGTEVDEGLES